MPRRTLAVAIALLLLTSSASSHADVPRRPDEGERLVEYLEKTKRLFLDSVQGLSEEQWNYRPAPGRWSIAEISQHITLSESLLRDTVVEILESPPPADLAEGSLRREDEVMKLIIERTERFQAPQELWPRNQWNTPEETLSMFRKQREEALSFARSDRDLRGHGAEHPVIGPLDAYGWLVFLSGHTERHTLQIREVKADPGFPRSTTR